MAARVRWPEGKSFAFTVFDDTDAATLGNCRPVYDLLRDCGLRTTKSVWPLAGREAPAIVGGATCADPDYLRWVLELQKDRFEIGFHNATFHSSTREQTIRGLDRFRELFGRDPKSMANHTLCREGMYWGSDRLSGCRKILFNLLTANRARDRFTGHVEGSEYFWGDICRQRIKYVRNFVFGHINTLQTCPFMPYHDPDRPFVNCWFASAEGGDVRSFTETIRESNQDELEAEGGACIMYAHFGKGFFRNGEMNPRFKMLIKRLAGKKGWFVPVSTLLDYVATTRSVHTLTSLERSVLERKWLRHKILVGPT